MTPNEMALDVAHMWDMPEVVRAALESGVVSPAATAVMEERLRQAKTRAGTPASLAVAVAFCALDPDFSHLTASMWTMAKEKESQNERR